MKKAKKKRFHGTAIIEALDENDAREQAKDALMIYFGGKAPNMETLK